MKRGAIVSVAPPNMTYHMGIHPHVYVDVPGLLLATIVEGDKAGDEVGTMVVVKLSGGRVSAQGASDKDSNSVIKGIFLRTLGTTGAPPPWP